eukprot:m.72640 g.72640  ORF g.72640 m.72640 type:complete len:136 (+) comp14274_c0_seq3:114-521(+)
MELPPDVANLEHAATAALAAISSSPARSMTSPSSAAKRKARVRRLPESKAPHIMTSFDKDLNLAAITEVAVEHTCFIQLHVLTTLLDHNAVPSMPILDACGYQRLVASRRTQQWSFSWSTASPRPRWADRRASPA